jgi:hypothetical protein
MAWLLQTLIGGVSFYLTRLGLKRNGGCLAACRLKESRFCFGNARALPLRNRSMMRRHAAGKVSNLLARSATAKTPSCPVAIPV